MVLQGQVSFINPLGLFALEHLLHGLGCSRLGRPFICGAKFGQ